MSHNLINPFFIEAMNTKLEENKGYGEWSEYHPDARKMSGQIEVCSKSLIDAIKSGDTEMVRKHAINLANFAEKAYTEFGA